MAGKVPVIEIDPIPNQIILFLKYLCNKNVIEVQYGNYYLPLSTWDTYFHNFRIRRMISFGFMSFKQTFKKYGYLIDIGMTNSNISVRFPKNVKDSIFNKISREKDILLKFLKHLHEIRRISGRRASLGIEYLHSEFLSFVAKEKSDFSDLNIEHLLEEYNNSELDVKRKGLLFDVPQEVFKEPNMENELSLKMQSFSEFFVKQFLINICLKYNIHNTIRWSLHITTVNREYEEYSRGSIYSQLNIVDFLIKQKWASKNKGSLVIENLNFFPQTPISVPVQTLPKSSSLNIPSAKTVEIKGKNYISVPVQTLPKSSSLTVPSAKTVEIKGKHYISVPVQTLPKSSSLTVSSAKTVEINDMSNINEDVMVKKFLRVLFQRYKGAYLSRISLGVFTVKRDFEEYSKGSVNSGLKIVEFLLQKKWATENKGNFIITHPDALPKLPAQAVIAKPSVIKTLNFVPQSEEFFVKQFLRKLYKSYKGGLSRLSLNIVTVERDYKEYSKGSKSSGIMITEFLLKRKWATELKGNLIITHPDNIPDKIPTPVLPKPEVEPSKPVAKLQLSVKHIEIFFLELYENNIITLSQKICPISRLETDESFKKFCVKNNLVCCMSYAHNMKYINQTDQKYYTINIEEFMNTQLNISHQCYSGLLKQLPNFVRNLYNTEFRFNEEREHVLVEENLKKKFMDFCKTQNVKKETLSILQRSEIFGKLFEESKFKVTNLNGFLKLKITKNELNSFELPNFIDLKYFFENLSSNNVTKRVQAATNLRFNTKMMEFLSLRVQENTSDLNLIFLSLLLREIGLKLNSMFENHLVEVLKSLKEKIPRQRSKLRFLILDVVDLSTNNWERRSEENNNLDKEIVHAFVLTICKGGTIKHNLKGEFIKSEFSVFANENYLEPRNLNIFDLLHRYNFYEGSESTLNPRLSLRVKNEIRISSESSIYKDGEEYFVAFLESYYAKYGSNTVFLRIKFMNFCILRKSKFHIYYERIGEIYRDFLNKKCDITLKNEFNVEDLVRLLKNLKTIDIDEQKEILLSKFAELLLSKFNSEEISENYMYKIRLKDLKQSFIGYCETESVCYGCIEKIKNNDIDFKELVLAYDHKNVSFGDGFASIYITSEDVGYFEASNHKLFKDTLANLSFDNLAQSVSRVSGLRITADFWFHLLKSFEPYKKQKVCAQFMVELVNKIYDRLPDGNLTIKLVDSIKDYCSAKVKISASLFVITKQFRNSFKKDNQTQNTYKVFINQLLRENILVTSQKAGVPLISVFCAMKGLEMPSDKKKHLTASEIFKDSMDLNKSKNVKALFDDSNNFPSNDWSCVDVMRQFILYYFCYIGWNETVILQYNLVDDVFEVEKTQLLESFGNFCTANKMCEMNLMYILFMTDFLHMEKHQSCTKKLIFKFTIFNQKAHKFSSPKVEEAYKDLEFYSSYSIDLSYKIINWISEYQPKYQIFSHDEIFKALTSNVKESFSKIILLKHLESLYFLITNGNSTTISSRSFTEVLQFPGVKNFVNKMRNDDSETCSSFSEDFEDNIYDSTGLISKSEYFESKRDRFPKSEIIHFFGKRTKNSKKFYATNLGCYICEMNFNDSARLEEHIKHHKAVDGQYEVTGEGFFKIACEKKDEKTAFKVQNGPENISIEMMIFVDNNFEFVNFHEMPVDVKANESYNFCGNLHTQNASGKKIYPFFIIYVKESDRTEKIIEEYCYNVQGMVDSSEKFNLRSIKMPSRGELRPKAIPDIKICETLRGNYSTSDKEFFEYLESRSSVFHEFIETGAMNSDNCLEVLNVLVQLETIGLDQIYKKLAQNNVRVTGCAGEYSAELTLSKLPYHYRLESVLLPGDRIRVIDRTLQTKNTFDGTIYQASENTVTFTQNIRGRIIKPGNRFSVSFMSNGLCSAYQSIALQKVTPLLKTFFFPKVTIPYCFPSGKVESFFNETIAGNPEQVHAVENISSKSLYNYCPYILFGPPGTGKTSTIVESILHIFKNDPESKILVSTFSNAACDQVGRRLFSYLQKMTDEPIMLRIYSACYGNQMDFDILDDDYMEATNMCHVYHMFPGIPVVKTYRIIIATHYIVAKYVHSGLNGIFSHIFIDENGSSTIPDALCAIAGLWSPKVKVILSGDPKQLGPILKNERTRKLGFDTSLMERVMDNQAFGEENYNSSIQTRLVKNFRSHPKLLSIFSHRFYGGTLEACASEEKVDKFIGWKHLPNKDIPLIFHESQGDSTREDGGTSLWNSHEIEIVMKYVDLVLQHVKPSDIGIVSPYRKQYLMIKERLSNKGLYSIETGSTEIFQGKEKPVIIASTVRSNTKHVGFLQNKRISSGNKLTSFIK
ncbi:MOV10.2 family protein [Megaselia abdita]